MSGLLITMIVVELALTLVMAVLYVYDKKLEFNEDDTLILDAAEEHLMEGQEQIREQATKVEAILKWVAIGWLVFGLLTLAVYLLEGAGLI